MIGIDISDRSIKVAEITGRTAPVLRSVCWSPLPPNLLRRGFIQDVEGVAEALKDALQRCSPAPIDRGPVTASIPETQSFVRVIEVPDMSENEMEEAVQWAIREHIPFDLDRMYVDWQPLLYVPGQSNMRSVLVGAAQRDVVDPLLQVLDSTGLNVVALELEAQAIVRSLLPLQADDVRGILIVDLGATSTNVIYFDQGAMRFTASVPTGGDTLTEYLAQSLHVSPEVAAEKKAAVGVGAQATDQQVAAALREATGELVQKIERIVREIIAQASGQYVMRAILLSGGAANLPGIVEIFAGVFPGVPVQLGSPWTNLARDEGKQSGPLSTTDMSHFATALGLALRVETGL